MRKHQMLLILLSLLLILPSIQAIAAPNHDSIQQTEEKAGKLDSKDEMVYATLDANGNLDEIYVVNLLHISQPGTTFDYGLYDSIKNLTDRSTIEQQDNRVRIQSEDTKFYYQGNLKDSHELPWNITISYLLNGVEISPEELPGKEGHLQIHLHISANEQGEQLFFEHYMLQISLSIDPDIFSNLQVSDGIIANAGKNKQITLTVMPGQAGEFLLEADVIDFELNEIDIAALPSVMSVDLPEMDELTEDMKLLSDAIDEINSGVSELSDGMNQLNEGVASLTNGSQQFQEGMSDLDQSSSQLVNASHSIDKALEEMSQSLQDRTNPIDLSEMENLPEGLVQLADGLNDTAAGLTQLKENYSLAYTTLDAAMEAIPEPSITEEEIGLLYTSDADPAVLDRLIDTYMASYRAKETYSPVKGGLEAIEVTLDEIGGSLAHMSQMLSDTANQFSSSLEEMNDPNAFGSLQEAITSLSAHYGEFHTGLTRYTEGVSQLSASYDQLHSGMVQLSYGTAEMEAGTGELSDGTDQLHESTNDLPEQMKEEVDRWVDNYDKSDFEAISFVSPQNERINSVQFMFKTESIKKEEQEIMKEENKEEKSFWTLLKELFIKSDES